VQVQSVLFLTDLAAVGRGVDAMARAVEIARDRGSVSRVVVAYGDCSPRPVLDDDVVGQVTRTLRAAGVDHFAYTWFDANLGSAGGNNRLFEGLDSDLVFLLNPDTVLAPDTVHELVRGFDEPGVGIVEARQLPIEHAKDYDVTTGDTSWASGGCSMADASVIREIGGYDEQGFFLYCDDVDMSWRVRLAGHRVVHRPSARVFHDKRLTADGAWRVSPAEEYWSAEGALVLAHKFSRPDRVAAIRRDLLAHGSEEQRRAVHDFDGRREAGRLPDPIDADHRVGQFVDGHYARHRY
jgi:GT2 family glycosyltransferase